MSKEKCYRCGQPATVAGLCDKCAKGREVWERYALIEGDRLPLGKGEGNRMGWNWVWRVLTIAAIIVATVILGMDFGNNMDREHEFRSRLIQRESRP